MNGRDGPIAFIIAITALNKTKQIYYQLQKKGILTEF